MKRSRFYIKDNQFHQCFTVLICFLIILLFVSVNDLPGQVVGPTIQNDKPDDLPKSELAGENLTPYQPSGWDNKIVISSATGSHTSTAPFFNTQTLYVDWAVTNNGSSAITATFYSRLYIDGVQKAIWFTSGLAVGALASVQDYNIGMLSSGAHAIKIVTDATGVITETNETDNE